MPFEDILTKERQIESFLQLWLRKFLPTLNQTPGKGGESSDIMLWPVHQGSQMPQVPSSDLSGKAYKRDQESLDRLYKRGGPA